MNRNKKHNKIPEEMYWDCSVCTYRNKPKAFKCQVCDVRKGTSTRKPKINPHIAAQHSSQSSNTNLQQKVIKKDEQLEIISSRKPKKSWQPSRLKNVDRNSGQAHEVTINNLTISVTEYRPKDKNKTQSRDHSAKLSVETKNRSNSSVSIKKVSKVNR